MTSEEDEEGGDVLDVLVASRKALPDALRTARSLKQHKQLDDTVAVPSTHSLGENTAEDFQRRLLSDATFQDSLRQLANLREELESATAHDRLKTILEMLMTQGWPSAVEEHMGIDPLPSSIKTIPVEACVGASILKLKYHCESSGPLFDQLSVLMEFALSIVQSAKASFNKWRHRLVCLDGSILEPPQQVYLEAFHQELSQLCLAYFTRSEDSPERIHDGLMQIIQYDADVQEIFGTSYDAVSMALFKSFAMLAPHVCRSAIALFHQNVVDLILSSYVPDTATPEEVSTQDGRDDGDDDDSNCVDGVQPTNAAHPGINDMSLEDRQCLAFSLWQPAYNPASAGNGALFRQPVVAELLVGLLRHWLPVVLHCQLHAASGIDPRDGHDSAQQGSSESERIDGLVSDALEEIAGWLQDQCDEIEDGPPDHQRQASLLGRTAGTASKLSKITTSVTSNVTSAIAANVAVSSSATTASDAQRSPNAHARAQQQAVLLARRATLVSLAAYMIPALYNILEQPTCKRPLLLFAKIWRTKAPVGKHVDSLIRKSTKLLQLSSAQLASSISAGIKRRLDSFFAVMANTSIASIDQRLHTMATPGAPPSPLAFDLGTDTGKVKKAIDIVFQFASAVMAEVSSSCIGLVPLHMACLTACNDVGNVLLNRALKVMSSEEVHSSHVRTKATTSSFQLPDYGRDTVELYASMHETIVHLLSVEAYLQGLSTSAEMGHTSSNQMGIGDASTVTARALEQMQAALVTMTDATVCPSLAQHIATTEAQLQETSDCFALLKLPPKQAQRLVELCSDSKHYQEAKAELLDLNVSLSVSKAKEILKQGSLQT